MNAVVAVTTVFADSGYGGPDEWKFVLAGWGLVAGGIAAYAAAVVRKGRKLSKELRPEERRWMS